MPQLQNVVLKDRATTPVDHTFTPRDIRDGVGTVVETTGVPVGNSRLSVALRLTPSGSYKGTMKLAVPVVVNETINGVVVPKVARTSYANIELTFDATSAEAERNNLMGMLESAFKASTVLVNDTFVKLQGVY